MDIDRIAPIPALGRETAMREAAQELEATFLAEMLDAAGLGETPDGFGGGPGEDQFAGLLRMEQARLMAERGGIGLAESIYNAMKDRLHDTE